MVILDLKNNLIRFETNQEDIGKKLGISQSMASRLEKGKNPSVELLLKISEVFGKSMDWILKHEG
ncbi:MAG: hypothetical protein A3G93_11545 [Nitrospinae bacterium RIFCSPLOWO2_12_FULL_45_22]|nr:MAG: hypothetical protein A3G93_11545 [Nitrospinae bacterium RIFCSPLOWO2_12_FULL_45_22]